MSLEVEKPNPNIWVCAKFHTTESSSFFHIDYFAFVLLGKMPKFCHFFGISLKNIKGGRNLSSELR